MFFMGGMTMGYLHPPQQAKEEKALNASSPEQNSPRQVEMNLADCQREGAVERTLIWARRILC
jgi:hypothetical protein